MSYSYEANLYYRSVGSSAARKPRTKRSGSSRSFVGSYKGFSGNRPSRKRGLSSSMSTGMSTVRRGVRSGAFSKVGKAAVGGAIGGVAGVGAVFVEAWKSARNIKSGKMKIVIQPSMVIISLIVVAVSLSLIQLAHFNLVATKGYELRRLEADRQQLLSSYEIKNMKLAEVKSLSGISGSDRASAMVRPASVEFMRGNTALAQLP